MSPHALTEAVEYPLYVVTATAAGQNSGCLAGFVTQASIEPHRYLICISKANHTFDVAEQSQNLALHLLGSDQAELASLFGEVTGDMADKFAATRWSPAPSGAPLLRDCAAWVEGPIVNRVDCGDHVACVIDAVRGGRGDRSGQFTNRQAADFEPGHPA